MARSSVRPARSHLQRRLGQLLGLVLLGDLLVMVAASLLAWSQRNAVDIWWDTADDPARWQPAVAPWLIALWLAVLVVVGAYSAADFGARFEEFRRIVLGSVIALGIVGFLGFLVESRGSRGYPLLLFVFGTPMLLGIRYADRKLLHWLRRRGHLVNRVVAVGGARSVGELVAVLQRQPWTGYRVLGMCVPPYELETAAPAVPILGAAEQIADVVVAQRADTVLVAGGSYSSAADLRRVGWAIEGLGVDLLVVPSLTDVAGPRIRMHEVAGLPLLHVAEPQINEAGGLVKRCFDVVGAALGLLVLSPLLVLLAVLIRRQDGGPALYRQRRVGLGGTEFAMLKFRSMVVDADRVRVDLLDHNEAGDVLFKIREDPRVTPVGRFLRRYSLDELPQLVNVLRGEMSLVGPRPPLPDEVARYDRDVHRRLLVKPGMTGLWQVSGRSDLSWEEAVRLDLYYVDNWSFVSDLVILLKTIRAVLLPNGAY